MTEGVSVKIGADTTGLEEGVARSKSQLGSLSTEVKGAVTNVAALTAAAFAAGGAIAIGLAAKGLEAVDAQAKLSRQLGGTVSGLRALEGAAGDAGVSSGAMAAAMQRLNRTIGSAQAGTEISIKAFDRLGLSAENLAGMDVDERMAAIADAVKQSGMNAQQTASALADLGIRQSEIINLVSQGGDAIRAEAETVDALGLSISEIDAAQIEAANDAMGIFGDIMTGVQTQLAVEVAPIITALATMLEDAAKEAGGVGEATSDAFGFIVDSVAFVISAVDGVKRAFQLVSDGVIIAFSAIAEKVASVIADVLRVADKIPGIDFSEAVASLNEFSAQSQSVINEAWGNINNTLNEPLAGETFKRFVADARIAGEAAAKAAVEGRNAVLGDGAETPVDTGDEKAQEQFAKDIAAWNAKNAAELEAVKARFVTEEQLLAEHRELMNIIGDEYDAAKFESEDQWRSISEQAEADHQAKLTAITSKEAQARKQALGDALNQMTTLMNTNSRKAFEIGKAAAIAQTLISTYEGAQKAYSSLAGIDIVGPALGAAAAAAAIAGGMARISAINSQSFGSGGGAAGSVTDQVNSNSGTVGGGGQQQQQSGGTYRFEGLSSGSFVSSDMVVEMLKQAQKDGALRGQLEFA